MQKLTATLLASRVESPIKPVCDDDPRVSPPLSSRKDHPESRRRVLFEVMGRTLTVAIALAAALSESKLADDLLSVKNDLNKSRGTHGRAR